MSDFWNGDFLDMRQPYLVNWRQEYRRRLVVHRRRMKIYCRARVYRGGYVLTVKGRAAVGR